MSTIILAEHHHQVYYEWARRGTKGLAIAHVDFHCDMRGLLIDRPSNTAFFTSDREASFIDRGNFLAHALMDGIVSKLVWVHDQHGGRAFDMGPVVGYESDLFATLHQRTFQKSHREKVEFDYSECLLEEWRGLAPGEQLDLDWDALASIEFDQEKQDALISGFLEKDLQTIPETTFLVYSPGYSNPDRNIYHEFSRELAKKFKADIVSLPALDEAARKPAKIKSLAKNMLPKQVIGVKKSFVSRVHQLAYAKDVEFYR